MYLLQIASKLPCWLPQKDALVHSVCEGVSKVDTWQVLIYIFRIVTLRRNVRLCWTLAFPGDSYIHHRGVKQPYTDLQPCGALWPPCLLTSYQGLLTSFMHATEFAAVALKSSSVSIPVWVQRGVNGYCLAVHHYALPAQSKHSTLC